MSSTKPCPNPAHDLSLQEHGYCRVCGSGVVEAEAVSPRPCYCDCHAFWIGDSASMPGAAKCCPACPGVNETSDSVDITPPDVNKSYTERLERVLLNINGLANASRDIYPKEFARVELALASILALNREYIGEDDEAHKYGSDKQLAMDSGDQFENHLALARNALRANLRREMGGRE